MTGTKASTDDGTWQTKAEIPEKERYGRYLASREWAERKRPVKERSGGRCERCRINPADAVHHLTYERKYAEPPEDLQDICEACHKFMHGKSDEDPAGTSAEARFQQMRITVLGHLAKAMSAYKDVYPEPDKFDRLLVHLYAILLGARPPDSAIAISSEAQCYACYSRENLIATHIIDSNTSAIWCFRCLCLRLEKYAGQGVDTPQM